MAGDLHADEQEWEPLDARVAEEVFNRLEHTERDSDDEWWFTGPSGLDAMLAVYADENSVPRGRRVKAALAGGVIVIAGVLAGSAGAANGYCSPTGDYCTSTTRRDGAVFLQLRTFSFRGRIRICVTDPRGRRVCRRFLLRARPQGVYEVKVRWHRHYPNGGPGRYRVVFLIGGTRLGPVLDFRLR